MTFPPRGKFFSVMGLLAIAVATAALIIFISLRTPDKEAGKETSGAVESPTPRAVGDGVGGSLTKTSPFNIDTDGDGLPDWEEKLRGTDLEKSDTDGDGASDGEEVRLGKNPLKPGPNDAIIEQVNKLSEEISSAVTIKKTVPVPVAPEAQNMPTSSKNPDLAPSDESASRKTVLRAYGNVLGAIIKRHRKSAEEEMAVLNGTIGATTPETSAAIQKLADRYRAVATDMNIMTVPAAAAGTHSRLAAAYNSYAAAADALALGGERISGEIFTAYSNQALALGRAILETARFFVAEAIFFSANEDGELFSLPY